MFSDNLHPLYMPVVLKSGLEIYYDKFNGYVTLEKPVQENLTKGGILADEMGLGKTVEVLALILMNSSIGVAKDNLNIFPTVEIPKKIHPVEEKKPIEKNNMNPEKNLKVPQQWVKKNKSANYMALEKWYNETLSGISTIRPKSNDSKDTTRIQCICGGSSKYELVACTDCGKNQHESCLGYQKTLGAYCCPQCWMEKPLIDCHATLIVTPVSLRTQWCKEITRHVESNLKVLVYEGFSSSPVYPTSLDLYDIVITTYSVLQNELRLTNSLQVSDCSGYLEQII